MAPPQRWRFAPEPHPCVEAIDAFEDNYIWLLRAPQGRQAVVVDPGDAGPVERALAERGLHLSAILLTHHHPDHVGGVQALAERWRPVVYGPATEAIDGIERRLAGGDSIVADGIGAAMEVLDVPGHTRGHIAYAARPFGGDPRPLLFCGDTLFAAGCGRVFEGTAPQMVESLGRLAALPAETLIYCAHEYTLSNLRFAAAVEPRSEEVAARLADAQLRREAGESTVPSTIGVELASNPFLRAHLPEVQAAAAARLGRPPDSVVDAFAAIREWKNAFR